jgi:DNA-binding CsgD family transcriptional regulator
LDAPPAEIEALPLSPRERQTLWKLLAGRGEKQIAAEMKLSINTVHHYAKRIYKHFGVSSRAELLALWVDRAG